MQEKLNLLWVNDNKDTAHSMVFMYSTNAKIHSWFEAVSIIIWGATAKLVGEDESIQEKIKMAQHAGVDVKACIACANMFGVTEKLQSLGIDVFPMGNELTRILKSEEKLLTI